MSDKEEVRVDKYLWAIRMYKTRTLASDAIDGGKVKLNGDTVKASKKVKLGERYLIKREQQTLEIEAIKIIDKRVSAPIAEECYKIHRDSREEQSKIYSAFIPSGVLRDRGLGRPTKKDRREMDDFLD